MKKLILIAFLFSAPTIASQSFSFSESYKSTGWSGKLFESSEKVRQRALFKCAKSNSLTRNNFIAYPNTLGFSSQNDQGKNGISFLTEEGDYKFLNYESIPEGTKKITFEVGKMTFVGTFVDVIGGWIFAEIPTQFLKSKDINSHKKIVLENNKFNENQERILTKETNVSLEKLSNSNESDRILGFSDSNISNCLKTASMNKDRDVLASIEMISNKATELTKKKLDSDILKHSGRATKLSTGGSSSGQKK